MTTTPAARVPRLYAAVPTPLEAGGAIDQGRLARHARDLVERGCEGIALFGTSGEGQAFSVEERQAALDALIASGFPAARVIAGVGAAATPDVVRLARHAVALGCPAVLLLPFFLFREPDEDGLFAFHAEAIEGVGDARLRVLLYHLPAVSGVAVRPALVERLVARYGEQIAGVKDSSGDWPTTEALLDTLPGLDVFVGAEPDLRAAVARGAAGGISGLANLVPELLLRGMHDEAAQPVIEHLVRALIAHPVIPALKCLLAAQTGEPGWERVRAPLMPLGRSARAALLGAWTSVIPVEAAAS